MKNLLIFILPVMILPAVVIGQSGRVAGYSESKPSSEPAKRAKTSEDKIKKVEEDSDVIKIDTELVLIPAQITDKKGKPILGIKQSEFKIFENDVEQEIAYFSGDEQPFTVALVLDMSYSSVFKLEEIQNAAMAFINQLRPKDRVMIVSFDEEVRILCEATNSRKVLKLAIEAARVASGTSLYTALDTVLRERLKTISGRKAIVLLTDGVDTTSQKATAEEILKAAETNESLIYPIQYDTYDDVQKSRKNDAQVFYDEDDRPYIRERPLSVGEREEDYRNANDFLNNIADRSGGSVYRVSSATNLNKAFSRIVEELRKVYLLGYYADTKTGGSGDYFDIRVRVYRQNLTIRAKNRYASER